MRLDEARALMAAGHHSGAYYLAGYAVEFGLKACIAGQFRSDEIPDWALTREFKTHRLDRLVDLAGLRSDLERRQRESPAFDEGWAAVLRWTEQSRYDAVRVGEADELLEAITRTDGVFRWIRAHW